MGLGAEETEAMTDETSAGVRKAGVVGMISGKVRVEIHLLQVIGKTSPTTPRHSGGKNARLNAAIGNLPVNAVSEIGIRNSVVGTFLREKRVLAASVSVASPLARKENVNVSLAGRSTIRKIGLKIGQGDLETVPVPWGKVVVRKAASEAVLAVVLSAGNGILRIARRVVSVLRTIVGIVHFRGMIVFPGVKTGEGGFRARIVAATVRDVFREKAVLKTAHPVMIVSLVADGMPEVGGLLTGKAVLRGVPASEAASAATGVVRKAVVLNVLRSVVAMREASVANDPR